MTHTSTTTPTNEPIDSERDAARVLRAILTLEAELALPDALQQEERRQIHAELRVCPPATCDTVALLAAQHGGVLGGFPIDPALLREAAAYPERMEPIAVACERIARCIRDEALRKQRGASLRAAVAIGAMKRLGHLRELGLESTLRVVRGASRRRRAAKKVDSTPTPVEPPK